MIVIPFLADNQACPTLASVLGLCGITVSANNDAVTAIFEPYRKQHWLPFHALLQGPSFAAILGFQ
ncbi:hypothetical protein D3C75_945820 [compost metagenome]